MGPRRPSSFSRIRPVATGGSTNGRVTIVSMISFPGQRYRAKGQANAMPIGRITKVLRAQTASVKRTMSHSAGVGHILLEFHDEAVSLEYLSTVFQFQKTEETFGPA